MSRLLAAVARKLCAVVVLLTISLAPSVAAAGDPPFAQSGVQAAAAGAAPAERLRIHSIVFGRSVQGRDLVAYRLGTPGGRVVLVIGNIHGDEPKGAEITRLLRSSPVPTGIDLYVIDTINPDGYAANTRQNANGVDLNRNFAYGWGYIPRRQNNGQYSGEAPADQPETKATQDFVAAIRPAITVNYHQDANRVSLGGARKEIPATYARLVGLSTGDTPCTSGCTGTAGSFFNAWVQGGTSFLVELPGSAVVDQAMVALHANALLTVMVL